MDKHIERIYQLLFEIEELCTTKERKTIQGNFDGIQKRIEQLYKILNKILPDVEIKKLCMTQRSIK